MDECLLHRGHGFYEHDGIKCRFLCSKVSCSRNLQSDCFPNYRSSVLLYLFGYETSTTVRECSKQFREASWASTNSGTTNLPYHHKEEYICSGVHWFCPLFNGRSQQTPVPTMTPYSPLLDHIFRMKFSFMNNFRSLIARDFMISLTYSFALSPLRQSHKLTQMRWSHRKEVCIHGKPAFVSLLVGFHGNVSHQSQEDPTTSVRDFFWRSC